MSIVKRISLFARDSKGKIRQINITCDWNEQFQFYSINRESGLKGGKFITHTPLEIKKGKVKRTISQQMELEYNSLVKTYLDKGYIEGDVSTIEKTLPKNKTNQEGVIKPMLAKLIQSVPKSTLDKVTHWYSSRKIDGTRALLYMKNNVLHFASRGGGTYDYATSHIRNNPKLIEYFKQNPKLVLDGELYVFGKSLQTLSGCARLEEGEIPFKLQYYVYDIVDLDKTFTERYKIIQKVKQDLNLGFNPNKTFNDSDIFIQILPQEYITNDEKTMWKLHNQYVSEGWEGAVLRDPSKKYNPGARDMIKLKSRLDSEFETIGYEFGLRGVEDIVFKMKTKDGKEFKAKPVGSKEVKESLFNHINDIIGQMATCTYFYLSDDGIPLQPVWKCVRNKIDM